MLHTPESTISLSDEQTAQLEVWQARLEVVQDEIKKAELELSGIQGSTEQAEKRLAYLEEKITIVEPQIEALLAQKEKLSESIEATENWIAEQQKEHGHRHITLSDKEIDFENRENEIKVREVSQAKLEKELLRKEGKLTEEKALVDRYKEILSEAISNIVWK